MAQEIFSEEVKSHQFERTPARMVFPFRQTRNPGKEVFEKLSSKLKELTLPGTEYAEQYLFDLYSRNRRPNTLELNYTSIRFFLEFLKANGITCMETDALSRNNNFKSLRKTGFVTYSSPNIDFTKAPINLSMSVTFVNLHGAGFWQYRQTQS